MGHSIRMGESSTNLRNAIPNRWQRSAQYLRRILAAYWPLLRSQFAQHDCLTAAAALTFTSLLALVPLMTVTYIGLSLVPQYGDLWVEVQNFIFRNFVPASSELVQQKLTEFAGRARGLTTAGGIGIVSVALLMLVSIEKRFNAIWQVATPRWGVQRVLVYWGVLSLGPALLLIAVWSSIYLIGLPFLSEIRVLDVYGAALSYLPALLMFIGFTALYVVIPNSPVPLLHGLSGGALTMIAFQLAFQGFTMASQYFIYDAIFGAFAALPVFLLWLYLVWVIVLSGAVFVRSLSLHGSLARVDEPLLIKAMRVLQTVAEGHSLGEPITESEVYSRVSMDADQRQRILRALRELRLIGVDARGQWMLGRDLQAVSLWQLYQLLPDDLTEAKLAAVIDFPRLIELLAAARRSHVEHLSASLEEVI